MLGFPIPALARITSTTSTSASVSGTAIAVSLHNAAAANHAAAAQGLRPRSGKAYTNPQIVHAAAKMSACASELCANQMG